MIYIYYCIVAASIYLLIQSWINYRADKIDREISNCILFTSLKYKK